MPAGTYGMWLQPNEDAPWMFVLHSDTTLWHVPHPPVEEGFVSFPLTVDPGFRMTVTPDVGPRYTGEWSLQPVLTELDDDLRGEVTSSSSNYWEFTFEDGEPAAFAVRNEEDEVVSRGARAGG